VILSRIILFASILLIFFWLLTQSFDVYRYDLVGAIFEILWLPMLAALFVLPNFFINILDNGKVQHKINLFVLISDFSFSPYSNDNGKN